ncbi:MAG: DUF1640 domain-containing protein [Pseudomonadota bacterium]
MKVIFEGKADTMASVTFDTLKFVEKLEKAGVPRDQAAAIAEAQKDAFAEAMDTQLVSKSDLMEMENRLVKWSVGLALGQVAVIAALVKLL